MPIRPAFRIVLLAALPWWLLPSCGTVGTTTGLKPSEAQNQLKEVGYPVPKDAQALPARWVQAGAGQWVPMVLATFRVRDLEHTGESARDYQGWLLWDTGTDATGHGNPLIITDDFLKQLGFLQKNNKNRRYYNAWGDSENQNPTWVGEGRQNDIGRVKIELMIGKSIFQKVNLAAIHNGFLNGLNGRKQLGKYKVVGIMPLTLMSRYLFSMDYANQRIYVRPLGAARRTFFPRKPLAVTPYVGKYGQIYFPITLDRDFQGYSHLDTGSLNSWIDPSEADLGGKPVTSFIVGGVEMMKSGSFIRPKTKDKMDSTVTAQYGNGFAKEIRLIFRVGNDLLQDKFFTVDPARKQIYLENPGTD